MFGILLVVGALIIFLGSPKGALLAAVTIPLALLISFILMWVTDIPVSLLSLGTIDFGIVAYYRLIVSFFFSIFLLPAFLMVIF